MRILLLALALAAAACTPAQEAKEETPVASDTLPAPTPDDVAVRINAA